MLLFATILFGFHGVISNDTTWSDTAYLTGDVLVEDGVTLTIDPSTVVLYADTCEWDTVWVYEDKEYPRSVLDRIDLIVEGNLKAIGTSDDSIYLSEFEGYEGHIGNVILVNGVDSLNYCTITVGSGGLREYTGMAFSNVQVFISNSFFYEGFGIWAKDAFIEFINSDFDGVVASSYDEYNGFSGLENLLMQDGGELYFEDISISNTYGLLGAVVSVVNLDSCLLKSSSVKVSYGHGAWGPVRYTAGGTAGGCECINCQYIEVVDCDFNSLMGGDGSGMTGHGFSGGDGFGLYLKNCTKALLKGNTITDIGGGRGCGASYFGGDGGNAFGISQVSCGDLTIENNQISGVYGGPGGSGSERDGRDGYGRAIICDSCNPVIKGNHISDIEHEYIYIDSAGFPRIGGCLGDANRFMGLTDKEGYVIYNNSPNDIDATWNFWECSPSLIDSLIFDYYDDPTKGIVHYDNFTDVEEKESLTEPFVLGSNLVNDILHVSLAFDCAGAEPRLSLFDASGRRVLSMPVNNSEIEIDVSAFPRGVYFVSVNISEKLHITRKVILN